MEKMHDCNEKVVNNKTSGYDSSECSCSFCEEACNPNVMVRMPTYLDGFNIPIVLIVYGSLVFISFILLFLKRKF